MNEEKPSKKKRGTYERQVRAAVRVVKRLDDTPGISATSHILMHTKTLPEFIMSWGGIDEKALRYMKH